MKTEINMGLIVILLIAVAVSFSCVSSSRMTQMAYKNAMQTTETYATHLQRQFENYIIPAKTLAGIFGGYSFLPMEQRRNIYDDMMLSFINQSYIQRSDCIGVWTAWRTNALDGMDKEMGYYNALYTYRNGHIQRMTEGIKGWEDYLETFSVSSNGALISGPVWSLVYGTETPVITVVYKIRDHSTNEVVGIVGLNYIARMQDFVLQVSREVYDGTGLAGIYNNDGLTAAHRDESRVKQYIQDTITDQTELGKQMNDVLNVIRNGEQPLTLNLYSEILRTDVYQIYFPVPVLDTGVSYTLALIIPMFNMTKGIFGDFTSRWRR